MLFVCGGGETKRLFFFGNNFLTDEEMEGN